MNLNYVTREEVLTAYKKYKSYVYYDNTNLLLRKQIAEYESDNKSVDTKLEDLHKAINSINFIGNELSNSLDSYFLDLEKKLHYWKLPKKIETTLDSNDQLIKNFQSVKNIKIDKYIFHVNAPIEFHIISVLWIMKEGQYLVKNLENNYGYVLDKNEDNTDIVSGLRLFKPYYNEYQKWRDRSISSAKNILNEGQNTAIISLDLKNFYHSVKLDFDLVEEKLEKLNLKTTLTVILREVYLSYTSLLKKNNELNISDNKSILPIGFLSSGVLANWYLRKFDKKVINKINPVYYGRYVDDILISLTMGSLNAYGTIKEVILDYFVKNEILEEKVNEINKDSSDSSYRILDYEDLEIQEEKIIIMLFDKNEPTAVLDKFKNEIKKNSSEYRFLPTEKLINENFEEASSKIIYDGSKNKLRSVKEFQDDKFGISSFLAKKIFLTQQKDIPKDKNSLIQIVNFFKGSRILEYYSLWEKIFTLFVLNNDIELIMKFIKQIKNTFEYIDSPSKIELIQNYNHYLFNVVSLSISLKVEDFRKIDFFKEYIELAESFRKSRLVRKSYVKSVLSELVNHIDNRHTKYIDLTNQNVIFKLDLLKDYKFYPRYIHYHEIVLANYINLIDKGKIESINKKDIFEQTKQIFLNISNSSSGTLNQITFNEKDHIDTFIIQKNNFKNKLKIGVANVVVDQKIFEKSYIRKPEIDPKRKLELIKILNQAIEENIDLIVLPECSIPYSWLNWIVNYAHKKHIGLVFGLEHVLSKKNNNQKQKAYNLMVTLLPVQLKKYNSLFIDIRVKKHYSPEEARKLNGYGYSIPEGSPQSIFNWNNIHFTTFNCFELADINDRARFKSKVDLVVACEYNRDTSYFSNIIESSSRDLHCYFVQSNSADYGDNRIYQPTSSIYSDILKIKGGENSTLLVGTIDIQKIREFQSKEYELQKDKNEIFKPTPPDYKKEILNKRIEESENI